MSTISKCPKCREQVTVPDGVDPAARVRCPLCEVEYPLGEAMAEAPPVLILVDGPAVGGLPGDTEPAATPELGSEMFQEADSQAVASEEAAETAMAGDETPALDIWQKVDATPEIDFGEGAGVSSAVDTSDGAVETEAFAGITTGEADAEYEPREGAPAARPQRKKKKGGGRLMVEAILGGFLGLTVGYYLLSWSSVWFGLRVDLPKLPLPLLPDTMSSSDGADTDGDDAAKDSRGKATKSAKAPSVKPTPQPVGGSKSTGPGLTGDQVATSDVPPIGFSLTDPMPEPEPGPEPSPLPPDYVGPRDPPSFSSAELGLVLKAADGALYGEDASGEMTDEVYGKFCRLAYYVTFVEQEGSQLADRKSAVGRILEDLAASPAKRSRIASHAKRWLDRQDRDEEGVLLSGVVSKVGQRDGLQGATLLLTDSGELVTVMSKPPLPIAKDDEVLVLGTVIDDPAENLVGYPGSKARVVWGAIAVKAP